MCCCLDDDFDCCCCCRVSIFDVLLAPLHMVISAFAWLGALLGVILGLISIMPELGPANDPIGIRLINAYKNRRKSNVENQA